MLELGRRALDALVEALGVVLRGGEVLERVRAVNTVVLDKTGTLTVGHPSVTDVVALSGADARLTYWCEGCQPWMPGAS